MNLPAPAQARAHVIVVDRRLASPWPDLADVDWLLTDLVHLQIASIAVEYVAPEPDELAARLAACSGAEVVVVIGGLGSGADNVARAAIARAFNRELRREPALEAHLHDFYAGRHVRVPETAWVQADAVDGMEPLLNPGSPMVGWLLRTPAGVLAALPAEPHLAQALWTRHLRPHLEAVSTPALAQHTRTLKLVGLTSGEVVRRLGPVLQSANPRVEIVETMTEVCLRVVAHSPWNAPPRGRLLRVQPGVPPLRLRRGPAAAAEELVDTLEHRVRALVPYHLYGSDRDELSAVVAGLLRQHRSRLAIADAVTFGALSADFQPQDRGVIATSVAGAGASLVASFGPPADDAPDVIAKRVAVGVRGAFDADVGLALLPRDPSGVWLAADNRGRVRVENYTWAVAEVSARGVPFGLNLVRKVLLPALECC